MRITIVCDWWSPRIGGIESQLSELAPRLVAAGHHVHVLTATRQAVAPPGVTVEHMDLPMLGSITAPDLRRVKDIALHLEQAAPDVVHAHGMFSTLSIGAILAARRLGIASLLTTHSLLRPWPLLAAGTTVFRLFSWRANVLTAVSAAAARDLRLASGREVLRVPNGLNLHDWCSRSGRAPELRIVAVTRLVAKKSPGDLVHALRETLNRTRRTDITLTVAGDGPERSAIERLIEQLDLSKSVRLLGSCSRDRVRQLLADASMFAHPGRHEAFGLALLEARAAGLPVVAMDSGGVPDLIEHGRHGVLASTRQGFCAAMSRLASDDDLRARCAENASKDLDMYDWSQVVRQQESAYDGARAAQSNVVCQRRSAYAKPDATRN